MLYNQEVWGLNIILDLFFGGMGAAAFILAFYDYLKGERELSPKVAFFGIVSLLLGLLFLVSHLGKPEAAFTVIVSPKFTSVMTFGVFFNILFLLFGGLFVLPVLVPKLPYAQKPSAMKVLGVLGAFFAFSVMLYTGLLLARTSYPLWRSPAVPLLFVLTSTSAGAGLYMLLAWALKKSFPDRWLTLSLLTTFLALITFSSMLIVADVSVLAYRESIRYMLTDNLAATVLLLVLGFIAPLLTAILPKEKLSKHAILAIAIMLILQALLTRYLIVSSAFIELPW